jgi:hypothetical protein
MRRDLRRRRHAKAIQCPITQPIGVALAVFGKLDDALGNYFGDWVRSTYPKGRARHFKCDPHDALGFIIESEAVQAPGDRHLKRSVTGARTMLCRDMTNDRPVEGGGSPDRRCSQDQIDITSVPSRNDDVKHIYIEKPQPCRSPIASPFPSAGSGPSRTSMIAKLQLRMFGIIAVSAMRNRAEILALN